VKAMCALARSNCLSAFSQLKFLIVILSPPSYFACIHIVSSVCLGRFDL
jgi:hypothetical protein